MKKIGIFYHPKVEATLVKAKELQEFVSSRGVSVWICSAWAKEEASGLLNGTDLVLTIGGDGTIFRAIQAVIPQMTPVTGINLGKLGFMTELDAEEALEKLPSLLDAEGWIDERAMLQVEITGSRRESRIYHALNDVVVARGDIAHVIRVDVDIDGNYMTTFKADGVVLSTATGSTGYAMAAGGPVLYPGSEDMLLVPVAPHLTCISPLVLPGKSVVGFRVNTYHMATLSVDGHINLPLSGDDLVTVRQSQYRARFWRIRARDYFYSCLEDKLKGKQGGTGRKS